MSEQPSLNIEGLARLDLQPDEILAITMGIPGLTVEQCEQVGEYLAMWLADHGQPVAGVLVLPQGSQLAAIRAPELDDEHLNQIRTHLGMKPVAVNVDFSPTGWTSEQMDQFVREFTKRIQRQPPRQH